MPIRHIIESFRERNVLWVTGMQPILKNCNIPVGRGWDKTIDKVEAAIDSGGDYEEEIKLLKSCFLDHILAGDTSVKLFRTNLETIHELWTKLKNYHVPENEYTSSYPLPLSREKLESLDPKPKDIDVLVKEDQLLVIFCSTRTLERRGKVDKDKRKIVQYRHQFFDLVALRKGKSIIEVKVDLNQDMHPEDEDNAFEFLEKAFQNLCKSILDTKGLVLSRVINLFPVVDHIYNSREGLVSDLRLKTDEGSVKSERRPKAGKDLRDEDYHKAGLAKLRSEGIGFSFYYYRASMENGTSYRQN